MPSYIYFDVLDTARTKLGGHAEQVEQARQNRFRGQAEIKMAVISGWVPVFPQTYGWDSSALLDYGSEKSFAGKAFFSLVRQQYVRICLRNYDSIWDAALDAFANPAFRHLSAWREFNSDNPLEARRPLVETMRNWSPTPKYSEALSDDVRHRLNLLRELSSAVPAMPAEERELPRRNRLSNLIRAAAASTQLDPEVKKLLLRCTNASEIPDPDNRTAIDTFLDREADKNGDLVSVVREITNGCFNAVAAHCVRAHPALTLPRSMPVAQDVLLKILPGSMRSNVFEGSVGENEVSELKAVGWDDIERFVAQCRTYLNDELPLDQRIREAEGAKLIAKTIVQNDPQYLMKFEETNSRFNTAIWSVTSGVGAAGGTLGAAIGGTLGYRVAGPAGAIKGATYGAGIGTILASTLAGGLAAKMTSGDKKKEERDATAARLERKYLGVIEDLRKPAQTGM